MDDLPLHQTPEPLAHVATGDRNAYDRYFFNGYTADGSVFFAAALGVYPNRDVVDAAFSVVRDGVQTSVHASGRLVADRRTTVGPIEVRVLSPMRRLQVVVGPNDAGIEADVTFAARTEALEEPRFTVRRGNRVVMDYTRLTQFGTWTGRLAVGSDVVQLDGLDVLGSRDRSWGIRSVGEREVGAPGGAPQFFWLWAPLNLPDRCLHLDFQEDAAGRRAHANGDVLPLLAAPDAPVDLAGPVGERAAEVAHEVAWRRGTRRSEGARLTLRPHGGEPIVAELEPLLDFQMLGIGYLHPEWGHGMWKGEAAVGVESWRLDELDLLAPQHLHVQQLVRVRVGDEVGTGVLEQLVIGPHEPSGLTGLADGA
jgi:hypothetical protein